MTKKNFSYPPYPFTTLYESERFLVTIDCYWWIDLIDKITGEAKSFHPDDAESWRKYAKELRRDKHSLIENVFHNGHRVSLSDYSLSQWF